MISVIVLTCDSDINKNFCLRHCLISIINQHYNYYEIIVVDNGSGNFMETKEFVTGVAEATSKPEISYVSMKSTVPRGVARNTGAAHAHGDILLFMDEDVILVSTKILETISEIAKDSSWGCGATRLWTKGDWFNRYAESILDDLNNRLYESILANSGLPDKFIRGSNDIKIETRSMIGHFGYCKKNDFDSVGGFEDIGEAESFDDDILSIKLFEKYGLPKVFPELNIVHVNHATHGSRAFDFTFYFEFLINKNFFDFDSENLIFGEPADKITVRLNTIHYAERISLAYDHYINGFPLNRSDMSDEQFRFWQQYIRLEMDDFCRIVAGLLRCISLDSFILKNSTDYDNLAPVICALISSGLLNISGTGELYATYSFSHRRRSSILTYPPPLFNPKSKFNQFPCDPPSLECRIELLRNRYPYCEFLRIGIIGDDDFLADALKEDIWIQPIIIEKDPDILNYYAGTNVKNCIELDLLDISSDQSTIALTYIPQVHTFITDPPYTVHGALSFLFCGLSLMQFEGPAKEFYMIINPSIIGRSINQLFKILACSDIFVKEIRPAFSNYPLPKDYPESIRAYQFNNSFSMRQNHYSSTSDLYIFTASSPNLTILKNSISRMLFYEHYQL